MNEMLRELLEFSRGNYQLDLAPYDLAEIVAWAVQELAPVLERWQVDLQVDVPSEINLRVDGERLRRVLENLIDNAIQAVEQRGGRIIVRARLGEKAGEKNGDLPAAHVRVDVIDDGPGVPLEIRERIFEPFISYGKAGGTGLGLAIARGLIEAHGGLIGLDERPARGSDFYFILPLDEVSGSET
jgi:signal transduction histidine kinase